jgi:hypothetical protein
MVTGAHGMNVQVQVYRGRTFCRVGMRMGVGMCLRFPEFRGGSRRSGRGRGGRVRTLLQMRLGVGWGEHVLHMNRCRGG